MANVVRVLVVVLVIAVVLQLGSAVMGSFHESQGGIRFSQSQAVTLDATGTFTSVNDGEGYDETVVDSRGNAVNLTGADDSFVESEQAIDVASDKNWTLATWARVDNGAAIRDMTAISVNGRVIIDYNGTEGNWTAWYYDESKTNSYRVNISAPNQPQNWTHIAVVANGTHLAIYRNNTRGDVKNITTSSITSAPVDNSNWDGRLDETRTFDDALNSSQRQSLVDSPVGPQANANRTMRVMYDQPDADRQLIFFADGRLKTSNASFSSGMDGSDLVAGVDYEWEVQGPKIKPLAGGKLDGAPVAYVDYDFESALIGLVQGWANAVSIAALLPVLLVFAYIVGRLRM